MIVTTDNEVWYNALVGEHERKAAEASEDSGTRKAESVIVDELKQMQYDRSIRLTTPQALTLLSARIAARLHTLRESTTFQAEKREVYYRFLASYSKVKRESSLSIFKAVLEYVYNGKPITPMQAFCFGLFVQYCVNGDDYRSVQLLISLTSIRDWLLRRIDYYETLSNGITYQQRQEAIDAFIFILGLFH